MSKRLPFLCIVACLISAASYGASQTHVIDQMKLQFSVSELKIKKGDTVTFLNSDRPAHNILVTVGEDVLSSGLQQPGQSFKVPFGKAGTFPVACGIHPKMSMKIVVE
jgi:plastocyanin